VDEMDRECSMHGIDVKCKQYFSQIPKQKRSLGRFRQKWEDNITMGVKETGHEGVDWIHLTIGSSGELL
jgi:hypothetical protein